MELQIIKKEMFFLLLYGVIVLTMGLLMMGLYAYNSMFYLFEWTWLFYLGKLFSIIFMIREEPETEEEREILLEKEINEQRQTYIPKQMYLLNAVLQLINIFLICFELFYMNFGLFVICQAIIFIFYVIYTNTHRKMHYLYAGTLILAGIFSLAYYPDGNHRCYIGLIATLFQIGTNIYCQQQKEQFFSQYSQNLIRYVFSNSKFIASTGLCQFILWTIPILMANFIPCPEDQRPNSLNTETTRYKCPGSTLDSFPDFFFITFTDDAQYNTKDIYPIIIFIILLIAGSPLSYLDNKISMERLSEKKQIIEQLVFFPIQIWAFSFVQSGSMALYALCLACFIAQWAIGLYIVTIPIIQIFSDKKDEKYEPIEEDEDSELS